MDDNNQIEQIRNSLGLVHIYCGDGKGKTTAAAGLAIRAKGRGLNVLFVQFLKKSNSGELDSLRELGVEVVSGQPYGKFVFRMDDSEKAETRAFNQQRLKDVIERSREGIDLLIFDEILVAITLDMVDEQDVLAFLDSKPEHLEVVLTGRGPSDAMLDIADYVSEVVMRKHPYETSGLIARQGIEF